MSGELYIKINQKILINKKKVLLSDIASLHHSNRDVTKAVSDILVLKISDKHQGIYVMTSLKIIELIHNHFPELTVVNEGEQQFIIDYVPDSQPTNRAWEWCKVALVSMVTFTGAAFTIMAFNVDVEVKRMFDQIFKWLTGTTPQGATILDYSYSIGLPIGILLFFNHFSKKKATVDPTPIHVEMRTYEKQINEAYIEDADREGKTIDAD